MSTKTILTFFVFIFFILIVGCQKEVQPEVIKFNKTPVSEAGNGQTIQLPLDSVRLVGNGSDSDGKIVAYLWSALSGPTKATIIHPGAASTWVKGLTTGTYVFQLMVIDDKGATGVDTVSVLVKDWTGNQAPISNAGVSQEIYLPTDTARLIGSGTDSDGRIVRYEWQELAGPNVAYIVDPSSASTQVKGLILGTYLFQLKVFDERGLSGVDTMTVTVKNGPSFVLQPSANNFETMFAVKGGINVSDPGSPELTAASWTNGGADVTVRSAVRFDLSNIPQNANIASATLMLYSNPTPLNGNLIDANYGSNNSILIQRITSVWDRNTSWQNQPSITAADQIVIPHTNASRLDLLNIDVTNMVKRMISESNYGFMIKLQNETTMYTSRIFCSSKYADASKHPKLVITLQ